MYASAVLHVRMVGPDTRSDPAPGRYRHSVIVLAVVKGGGIEPNAIVSLIQNQADRTPEPYDPGQELVVFLEAAADAFRIMNDEPGLMVGGLGYPAEVFQIEDRRVRTAPPGLSRFVGARLQTLVDELRALSKKG